MMIWYQLGCLLFIGIGVCAWAYAPIIVNETTADCVHWVWGMLLWVTFLAVVVVLYEHTGGFEHSVW